jgi:hypothetical protein
MSVGFTFEITNSNFELRLFLPGKNSYTWKVYRHIYNKKHIRMSSILREIHMVNASHEKQIWNQQLPFTAIYFIIKLLSF